MVILGKVALKIFSVDWKLKCTNITLLSLVSVPNIGFLLGFNFPCWWLYALGTNYSPLSMSTFTHSVSHSLACPFFCNIF